MSEKPKKRFRLFDLNRDGKGVEKKDVVTSTGLKGFFYRYRLSFGKLLSVNILYVLGNIFLLFLILTLAGYTKQTYYTPLSDTFSVQNGIYTAAGTLFSSDLAVRTLLGQQTSATANTTLTYVFWALSALTVFTFGCVNTGCVYILRQLITGEPVFVWSDFWYAVKRNWKQALPLGILDAAILFLLPYNIYTMLVSDGNYLTSLLLWMNVILLILYFFMRSYMYLQLVTFDIRIGKLIKNAFIFALLGWKRNFMALFGTLLLAALEVLLLMSGTGVLLPLAIAMPLMIFFSHTSFMGTYAAYYVVKPYMIDPALAEKAEKEAAQAAETSADDASEEDQ